jgi:hypothetical protein
MCQEYCFTENLNDLLAISGFLGRPKEETVASILDIKFSNEVIEILIENAEAIFPSSPESSPEMGQRWTRMDVPTTPEDLPDRGLSADKELVVSAGDTNHITGPSPGGGRKHTTGSVAGRNTASGLSPVEERESSSGDGPLATSIISGSGSKAFASSDGLSQSTRSVACSGDGGGGQRGQQPFISGFSDLSVNSLPDMSLLRHQAAAERPRSKSHQHDSPPRVLTLKSPALQMSHATVQVGKRPGCVPCLLA